jgi:acyl-CoA thioesterase
MNRFQRDTAARRLAEGRYAARIDRGWWIQRGPNGGYVAAILLRALADAVGDAARAPRSLTVHYTSPPAEGEAEIRTSLERVGRSVTTALARLEQGGKLRALALASFGAPRRGPAFAQLAMPEVVPPERAQPMPPPRHDIPLRHRYESRAVFGVPGSRSPEAATGGWIRLREDPGPADAPLLAAYTDAWPPAVFTQLDPMEWAGGVPTLDLTVHFRAPWPAHLAPDDFVLVAFRSRLARDGFVEEDGEIWSRDGQLLAQSRQLGVIVG